MDWGSTSSPVPSTMRSEIVIADRPLETGTVQNPGRDPSQYGTGLIGLGKVTMNGATKDPTFVRLATEPRRGDSTLSLSQPVTGWRMGDRLVLPDSRQLLSGEIKENYVPQWEELTLNAIS